MNSQTNIWSDYSIIKLESIENRKSNKTKTILCTSSMLPSSISVFRDSSMISWSKFSKSSIRCAAKSMYVTSQYSYSYVKPNKFRRNKRKEPLDWMNQEKTSAASCWDFWKESRPPHWFWTAIWRPCHRERSSVIPWRRRSREGADESGFLWVEGKLGWLFIPFKDSIFSRSFQNVPKHWN